MLMGLRNRDDGKGNKNADYTKSVLHVTITYQNMLDLVAAFCAYHRLDLYVGENGKDGFWRDILSGLERLGEVICDISPLYKVFEKRSRRTESLKTFCGLKKSDWKKRQKC